MIGLWSVIKTVGRFDPSIKNSYSVKVYIIAVHSLTRVESRNSACVNKREFADLIFFLLFHCGIVIMLLRCKNLKHRTLHKMVD